jgi:hypothetical protein
MTDYGLIVKNENQRVQIDSKFKNFTFLNKSSTGTLTANGYTEIAGFTATSQPLLTYIQPNTVGYVSIHGFRKTGSVYDRMRYASSSTTGVNWMLFKQTQPHTPVEGDYGLLVYDDAGSLVFSFH